MESLTNGFAEWKERRVVCDKVQTKHVDDEHKDALVGARGRVDAAGIKMSGRRCRLVNKPN